MYLKQRTAFRSHPYCHGYTSERRSGNKWGEKNNKVPSVLKSSLSEHRCPLQLSPGCRQSSLTVLCLIIRPKWKLTARTTRKHGPWHKGRDDIIEMMACSGRKASEMGTIHLEPPPWGGSQPLAALWAHHMGLELGLKRQRYHIVKHPVLKVPFCRFTHKHRIYLSALVIK